MARIKRISTGELTRFAVSIIIPTPLIGTALYLLNRVSGGREVANVIVLYPPLALWFTLGGLIAFAIAFL